MECIKMDNIKPLAKFPVIATSRVDEAEYCLSQSLTDVQIDRVDDRRNFRLELNSVNFGRTNLVYSSVGAHTRLKPSLNIDHAILITGLAKPVKFEIDYEPHLVTSHEAVIVGPCKQIRVERPAQSEILYLRASLNDLWDQFEKLMARHHRGCLSFNRTANVCKGSGAMLKGLMEYLVSNLAINDSAMKVPVIRKSFDELLMNAMLALPHNKVDRLHEDRSSAVAPAVVCRAEEYIRAHLKKPINISDLIRVCDCSRSALFSAFRNTRNYTPMEFLTEQRLHHAREQLLESQYNPSVSSIALNSGFVSFSWFSQVYKKRFGERPSDTLRKGKCITSHF
jgi:AraC-like DNA-binding protein